MAEKSKKYSEAEMKSEADKTFLDKNVVNESMTELIAILSANRPADPLQFMADYFRSSYEQSSRLERCHQTIILTHHTRSAFNRNLITAFEILNQTKLNKQVNGINGGLHNELLNLLLRELPDGLGDKMKHKLSRRQHDAVTFEYFQFSVTCIMIYKDYCEMAKQLFSLMDVSSSGNLSKQYADTVLQQLKESLSQLNDDSVKLRSCYGLSPPALYKVFSQVQETTNQQAVTYDQFMVDCSDYFIQTLAETTSES